jgi:heme-degrading monooxygenase HmoA
MADEVYTLGVWRVLPGREEEFVEGWRALGAVFRSLDPPPGAGVLVQSVEDPRQYYSFGPWPSIEAVAAMRERPEPAEAIARLAALCEEAKPGLYRVVARS